METGQESGSGGALLPGAASGRPLSDRPLSHESSVIEKVLEYHFLAALTAELLRRGSEFEVLRSDIDRHGHDIVIEADGILRHIQLKAKVRGGKNDEVTVNMKLAGKPSGCVVWMDYDPASFALAPYRWLGGSPGSPLPPLGDRIATHSRGKEGVVRKARPAHRVVRQSRFEKLDRLEVLVDRLFGAAGAQ